MKECLNTLDLPSLLQEGEKSILSNCVFKSVNKKKLKKKHRLELGKIKSPNFNVSYTNTTPRIVLSLPKI